MLGIVYVWIWGVVLNSKNSPSFTLKLCAAHCMYFMPKLKRILIKKKIPVASIMGRQP